MNVVSIRKRYARIVAKVWVDPTLLEKLLENPRETLKQEGLNIPRNVEVRIDPEADDFDCGDTTWVLPIIPMPRTIGVASDDLEDVAFASIRCCCPPEG